MKNLVDFFFILSVVFTNVSESKTSIKNISPPIKEVMTMFDEFIANHIIGTLLVAIEYLS